MKLEEKFCILVYVNQTVITVDLNGLKGYIILSVEAMKLLQKLPKLEVKLLILKLEMSSVMDHKEIFAKNAMPVLEEILIYVKVCKGNTTLCLEDILLMYKPLLDKLLEFLKDFL